jgi:hypothetical protein
LATLSLRSLAPYSLLSQNTEVVWPQRTLVLGGEKSPVDYRVRNRCSIAHRLFKEYIVHHFPPNPNLDPALFVAMAGTTNDFQNGTPFYLDATQQDLLLAALASNNQNSNDLFSTSLDNKPAATLHNSQYQYPVDGVDPTFFTSPQQSTPANAFGSAGMEESPFVDYLDGDNSFDFDNADDDLMIGALPGGSPSGKNGEDSSDKRKSPDDDADDDEGGGKRREGEDKQAKKPGRKPLTSEPTTVGPICMSRDARI